MKKYFALCILCLTFTNELQAQNSFRKIIDVFYGGAPAQDRMMPMTLTHDSAIVFCQKVQDSSNVGLGIFKINYSGNLVWAKFYQTPSQEHFNEIIELPDGSFALAGFKNNFNEVFFLKIDSIGDLIFYKKLGNSPIGITAAGYSVCISSDNNLVFAGDVVNSGYLIKTDFMGNIIWSKGYYHHLNQSSTRGRKVISTSDGGLLTAGFFGEQDTLVLGSNFYLYVLKTDIDGNVEWFRQIRDTITGPSLGSVSETSTGDFLISGVAQFPIGPTVVKFSATGEFQWYKIYSDPSIFVGMEELPDGNIMLCSAKFSKRGPKLSVIDTSGNVVPYFNIQTSLYNSIKYEYTGIPPLDEYTNYFELNESNEALIFTTAVIGGYYKPVIIKTDNLFNTNCYSSGFNITDSSLTPISIDTTFTINNINTLSSDLTPLVTGYSLFPNVIDFCNLLSVDDFANNKIDIDIAPNPFTTSISINIKDPQQYFRGQTHITIKNILGQTVFHIHEDNLSHNFSKTMDLSFLTRGIYLLDIIRGEDRIVRKIIKN